MKPTSKVIQISAYQCQDKSIITALCEDGSIWERYLGEWECILDRAVQLQQQAITNNN